jgi:RNA polymerase sigma-70 factor (ECF subfamily)
VACGFGHRRRNCGFPHDLAETSHPAPGYSSPEGVTFSVDDARLVTQCLHGDSAALREFLEHFQGPVFGLCLRLLGQREDAEEVTQETLVRAVRHLSHWDATRPLKPWVQAIAVNRCRTWTAKRKRQPALMEIADAIAAPRERLSVADLNEELQLALGELREEYRICFVLFHQEEQSCQQIAEVLDCPEGTIKTWLHRARKELGETLRRRGVVTEKGYELHGL